MANFVYVLVKGMDTTPGGADEIAVPKDQRLGQAVDLETRVNLLVRGPTRGSCTISSPARRLAARTGYFVWCWPRLLGRGAWRRDRYLPGFRGGAVPSAAFA